MRIRPLESSGPSMEPAHACSCLRSGGSAEDVRACVFVSQGLRMRVRVPEPCRILETGALARALAHVSVWYWEASCRGRARRLRKARSRGCLLPA